MIPLILVMLLIALVSVLAIVGAPGRVGPFVSGLRATARPCVSCGRGTLRCAEASRNPGNGEQ
jgi:hypothetical protein